MFTRGEERTWRVLAISEKIRNFDVQTHSSTLRCSCGAASLWAFPVLFIHMAAEVSLEDLLDSVADAVSALVLFASEVNTDKKKLSNLQEGVKMVQSATAFFTSDAGRTIKMWRDFGNERTCPSC